VGGTTLKDVAAHASVSHRTVSNVVNGREARFSSETAERVRASITALNYRPNLAARHLRKGPLGVLAVAIPDLANPFFSKVSAAIVAAAEQRGYTVLVDHTSGNREREALVANGLRPHLIDGVILNPLALRVEDIHPEQIQIPIVLLGQRPFGAPFDHVVADDAAAARLATEHLIGLGRRRIAAIGVPEDPTDLMPRIRLQGYEAALAEVGLPLDPRLVARVPPRSFQRHDGVRAMQHLLTLDPPPDAVFCFNDLVALGAMKTLLEADLRVPEDVAVIGFDGIDEALYATPSLSTVAVTMEDIAHTAVSLLMDRIQGTRTGPPIRVQLPFNLLARGSTIGSNFTFAAPTQTLP